MQKPFMQKTHLPQTVVSGRKKVPSEKASLEKRLLENQDGKSGHLGIANTAQLYYLVNYTLLTRSFTVFCVFQSYN